MLAVILFSPYCGLSAFLTARRRGTEPGVVAGMATAATGHAIVFLAAVIYSALTDPWQKPLAWAAFGASFLVVAVAIGLLWGLAGAAVARFGRRAFVIAPPDRWRP